MGLTYPAIDDKMRAWVARQKMFFVSTAPLSGDGLLNCSPKGMDSFRILDDHTVGYLDLTGSGIETVAHLRENGRIVIMFCAFEGPPNIVRFYGTGSVHPKGTSGYDELLPHFEELAGARSIIKVDVSRIGDSCGYSVPLYDHVADRDVLTKWAENKKEKGVVAYQKENNQTSLDDLPALCD